MKISVTNEVTGKMKIKIRDNWEEIKTIKRSEYRYSAYYRFRLIVTINYVKFVSCFRGKALYT